MNTGPRWLRAASLGGYVLLALAIIALYRLDALLAHGAVAAFLQGVAVALMIWARVTFGRRSFHAAANPTEGGLVTTGPYAYIRHPIYAAVLLFTWAAVLTHLALPTLAIGVVSTAGAMIRIVAEEYLVTRRYPEYAAYAARTRRLVPLVF